MSRAFVLPGETLSPSASRPSPQPGKSFVASLHQLNPGVLVGVALLALGGVVLGGFALTMARSGQSLRPLVWFAGFFLLIVGPQLAFHVARALRAQRADAARARADAILEAATDRDSAAPSASAPHWSGTAVGVAMVNDVRAAFGDVFAAAESAEFAVLPDGETVLFARFRGWKAAESAWVAYLQATGLAGLGGTGDSQRGWVVTRPVGDRLYALHFDNCVGVWTAADDAAIRRRMLAGGFALPRRAPLAGAETASSGVTPSRTGRGVPGWLLGLALGAYGLGVVAFFFKGAAWAGTHAPVAGVAAVPAAELAGAIAALGAGPDAAFAVERGRDANEWFVTWRPAALHWADLGGVRTSRRVHRVRLALDEAARTARVTDYQAAFDASVGPTGAALEWRASLGIVFFQRERTTVLGAPLGDGPEVGAPRALTRTFDLAALKEPCIAAVTGAGWTWRPVVWDGPAALRWLTE